MTVTETIRAAIVSDSRSRVDVARAAGLGESHLNHFVARRAGLTGRTLDSLAATLGLTIVPAED